MFKFLKKLLKSEPTDPNERGKLGLKPFPSRPDSDYFNTVISHCSFCGRPIYGGMAISFGWDKTTGVTDIRCEDHLDRSR